MPFVFLRFKNQIDNGRLKRKCRINPANCLFPCKIFRICVYASRKGRINCNSSQIFFDVHGQCFFRIAHNFLCRHLLGIHEIDTIEDSRTWSQFADQNNIGDSVTDQSFQLG